jgi:hypothetical protein
MVSTTFPEKPPERSGGLAGGGAERGAFVWHLASGALRLTQMISRRYLRIFSKDLASD